MVSIYLFIVRNNQTVIGKVNFAIGEAIYIVIKVVVNQTLWAILPTGTFGIRSVISVSWLGTEDMAIGRQLLPVFILIH